MKEGTELLGFHKDTIILVWSNDLKGRLMGIYLSSSFLLLSTENLYWNPEQPPPSTCILRYWPFSMISPSLWIKEENMSKINDMHHSKSEDKRK